MMNMMNVSPRRGTFRFSQQTRFEHATRCLAVPPPNFLAPNIVENNTIRFRNTCFVPSSFCLINTAAMSSLRLSPSTSLYPPTPEASQSPNESHPRAIILATWAFARDNHIARYVDQYRARFPGANIFVVKCYSRYFFWLPDARRDLQALVSAIRSIANTGEAEGNAATKSASKPKLLVHVFSNAGLTTTHQLHRAYMGEDERHSPLPEYVSIFDSSPGRYEYWSIVSAMLYGVPRDRPLQKILIVPIAHLVSGSFWVWSRIFGGEDWLTSWAQAANGPSREREVCRSYAYSRADPLIESRIVEAHAEDARRRGFTVVHAADFGDKSSHVAHARTDPTRYWTLVADTWEYATTERVKAKL
jgi:hypothetical protein